ncbi:DNA-binding protein HU [Candidatus Aerophobetes bacterium]|uniref:DNA-binding protein HU n=1 Tax=Aerophobetes bacterium TaxID=2030807 RepID=A0A497E7L6_UNCAE|nr:MAG: DNA-binding protein HU [Candidatus Aerophobetes bacterium]
MNKAQLIGEVANQTGLTRKAVRQTLDAMTSAIARALAQGEKVTLVGFGSFKVMRRRPRRGRNPRTGEEIQIPAKDVPKFEAGKRLKEAVS